jgi:hypothetical protein
MYSIVAETTVGHSLKTTTQRSRKRLSLLTPRWALSMLQAQAQEQMAAVSSIPLVKLLGIAPTGLNASSDGEIRVFYDYIHALQQSIFSTA